MLSHNDVRVRRASNVKLTNDGTSNITDRSVCPNEINFCVNIILHMHQNSTFVLIKGKLGKLKVACAFDSNRLSCLDGRIGSFIYKLLAVLIDFDGWRSRVCL